MTMVQNQPEIVVRMNAASAGGVVARRIEGMPTRRDPWPGNLKLSFKNTFWWTVGLAVCMAWDRAAWLALSVGGKARFDSIEGWLKLEPFVARLRGVLTLDTTQIAEVIGTLFYGAVYGFGRIWIWVLIAIVVLLRDWTKPDTEKVRHGMRRAVFIFACPAAAALAAEVLKVVTRRMRPEHADGFYRFKELGAAGWSPLSPEFWSVKGLGLASSHVSVAIAGALAAGMLWSRARWWFLTFALLTCASRVFVGAHFVSDVYVGATLGVLACAGFYAWDRRNHGGLGLAGEGGVGGWGGVERA